MGYSRKNIDTKKQPKNYHDDAKDGLEKKYRANDDVDPRSHKID